MLFFQGLPLLTDDVVVVRRTEAGEIALVVIVAGGGERVALRGEDTADPRQGEKVRRLVREGGTVVLRRESEVLHQ